MVSEMTDAEYLNLFLDDSLEQLETMNQMLLALETSPEDNNSINELFRMAHSMKGAAASMGFKNIASLTHETETFLDIFRRKEAILCVEFVDLLFECLDTLNTLLAKVQSDGTDNLPVELLVETLHSSAQEIHIEKHEPTAITEQPNKHQPEERPAGEAPQKSDALPVRLLDYLSDDIQATVKEELEKGCRVFEIIAGISEDEDMAGLRALVILGSLRDSGSVLQYYPDIENSEDLKNGFYHFLLSTEKSEDQIREQIGMAGILTLEFYAADESDNYSPTYEVSFKNEAGTGKVLVIDDSKYQRSKAKKLLRENSYEVYEAEDAIDGLHEFKKLKPDIVLLDINMPYMQGLEALKYLKKINPGVPVIIFTTVDDSTTTLESIKLGAKDYVVKPLIPEQFLGTIEKHLVRK